LARSPTERFADFSQEEVALYGDKTRIDSIVNQEVVVTGYRIRKSRFSKNTSGDYLTLQIEIDGTMYVCFTGSDVLIDQMKKYCEEIPFTATIKKINQYYTLT